ncbi:uncharacterized protein LOC133728301 isoform X2 [Rosa rugosa]|uniref:uncharacterized protein LOC133728298 isoform X2 n=1 Tax=Rosa rugosa TaxID=74645 RepID=UPI002B4103DC|nr:uncharacterized protein LOC133728298 isoform X2 [Rosa rugosa]XP_062011677.1 uncharacterized protein LOC133728299 isoform X2 [Rosa rugosa]XP_062011679.1 uncharacterized protein LOC133728301 isoform X2 [Rosa rugosa]
MESFLRGQNLFGFVDGSTPCPAQFVLASDGSTNTISVEYISWKTQDQSIVNMIGQTLSVVAMTCAVGSKSAQDLWTRLKLKFADANKQNILQLKSNLQNVKKGTDDIETYLDKIKAAKDALETVGVSIDDEDIVVTVLNGLPSEFAAIKTVIRAQFTCASLSQLKTLLKAAEMDIGNEAQGLQSLLTAMLAKISPHTLPSSSATTYATSTPPSSVSQQSQLPQTQAIQFASQASSSNTSAPPGFTTQCLASSAPPGVVPQGLPSFPMSTQTPYVPIPAMPYGFTPMFNPVFNPNNGMTGFYAGRGPGRFQHNAGRGNNFGGRGNGITATGNQNGGFRTIGNNNVGGGNSITCQWCNKVGHSAKTCRSLPMNLQGNNNSNQGGCQYCGRHGHTADRCFFIIGFPGQQNDSEDSNATAMVAAAPNLAPQFWLADTGATNHMTNNLQLLNNVVPYPNTDGVQIGQGAGQDIIPGTE